MTPTNSSTPTEKQIAEFQFESWSAPEVTWTIEYPLEVMNEIRAYACNELVRLSHGGAEVGGIMYGSLRGGVIRILTWRPIICEYTDPETLRLSHADRMTLAVQLEAARRNPELKDLRPVGWFVSHPRGGVAMNDSDLELYSGFFPESSQVTLVIHPASGGRAEAGFFAREADGAVRSEASYKTFSLEPVMAPPYAADAAPPPPQEAAPSEPASPAVRVAEPVSLPEPSPRVLPAPVFRTDEPLPARERWLWAIPIALALGLGAWLLQRQKPVENTSMAFRISSSHARAAQLEWDPNSRAIRDSQRGELDITDGANSSQVPLSSDQLHSGKMTYLAQSGDVGFQLTVYPRSGNPVHEATRLIAPASSAPVQPPQLLGRDTPAPLADSGAATEALQKQVRQLTEDLRKERARTGELQNLNRILENRLNIQPTAPKSEPPPQ